MGISYLWVEDKLLCPWEDKINCLRKELNKTIVTDLAKGSLIVRSRSVPLFTNKALLALIRLLECLLYQTY